MPTPDAPTSDLLAAALSYVRRGWPVFPVHVFQDGRCSCGAPKCQSPGKHPRTPHGLKDASLDPAQIQSWWRRWPTANVGICTGAGLVVVDVDAGREGLENLAELEARNGALPAAPESLTGGGGRHLLFSCPVPLSNSADRVARGVDIRADGGYIVAPPSLHPSGRRYTWEASAHPDDIPAPELPAWLLSLATRSRSAPRPQPEAADHVVHGARNETLFRVACSMRARGLEYDAILAALLAHNAAKCVPPLDEAEVRAVAKSSTRYDPGTVTTTGAAIPSDDEPWMSSIRRDSQGQVKKDPGNAALILANDARFGRCLARDAFSDRIIWTASPPALEGLATPQPGEVRDEHALYAQQWISKVWGVSFPKAAVQDAMLAAAAAREVDPLRDYLLSLEWDGKHRLAHWLSTYLGAQGSAAYLTAIGDMWLVSAVARGLRPGCQVDHVPILEGGQGAGKSSAVRILGGEWYLGSLPDIRSKDAADALCGAWMCEIGELDAVRGAGATRVKDFVTCPIDIYRPAYGRFKVTRQRRCIFVGTTNESQYLADSTGARRFWPVSVTVVDRDGLARDRDQLFAEAVTRFHDGCAWWPSQDIAGEIETEQADRYEADPWEAVVAAWAAERRMPITTESVLADCLGVSPDKMDRSASTRVGRTMRRLGWERRRVRRAGALAWEYHAPTVARGEP